MSKATTTCGNTICTMHDSDLSEDKYCWKCGEKTVSLRKCSCGQAILGHFDYCPNCGKDFTC